MHPLAQLDFSKRVAKRAQYEALDISICGTDILVRNESHATPEDHEYTVSIDDGIPVSCTCPADARFEGACKHRVAVAIRRPLLDTLESMKRGDPPIAADGGLSPSQADGGHTSDTSDVSTDSSADLLELDSEECPECLTDFPCWECYRTGIADFD
ncbi:SWIM zinc finger domain-containing protein [Haloarcula sp. S1CR25-12]|uniref:SWIM zinc finger domain-containing protein n=1 Tax=Haloarcula saliterrae TaxID=2950534 RepID=A0ABU2FE38_9EURY|nr:SWIM zinc finger family protein [Haloarcula sp. S1CR25-12]MDS0260528.1 SWIM zinc finger domain-containing protein [Haloarcula sp. S1CR25-12]